MEHFCSLGKVKRSSDSIQRSHVLDELREKHVSVCRSLECPSWRRALNLGWMWSWPSPPWPSESHTHTRSARTCMHTHTLLTKATKWRSVHVLDSMDSEWKSGFKKICIWKSVIYYVCFWRVKDERWSKRRMQQVAASLSDPQAFVCQKICFQSEKRSEKCSAFIFSTWKIHVCRREFLQNSRLHDKLF